MPPGRVEACRRINRRYSTRELAPSMNESPGCGKRWAASGAGRSHLAAAWPGARSRAGWRGRGPEQAALPVHPSSPRGAIGQLGREGGRDRGGNWCKGFWRGGLVRGGRAFWCKGFCRGVCACPSGRHGVCGWVRVPGGRRRRRRGAGGRKWYIGFCRAGVVRSLGALWYTGFWCAGVVRGGGALWCTRFPSGDLDGAVGRDGMCAAARLRGGGGRRGGGAGGRKWYKGFCQAGVGRGGSAFWCKEFCQKGGEEGLRRRATRTGAPRSGAARTGARVRVGSTGGGGLLAGGPRGLAGRRRSPAARARGRRRRRGGASGPGRR